MTYYTIATKTSECYGMGSYGEELKIEKEGDYGTGNFPPLFKTRGAAEMYLRSLKKTNDKEVVKLKVL